MRYQVFAGTALALCALTAAGCGKAKEVAQEKVIEHALSKDGTKAIVDISQGAAVAYAAQNPDGSTIAAGENVSLPQSFPKDVPVVKDWKIQMANTQAERHQYNLLATSTKKLEELDAFFKKEFLAMGWTEAANSSVPGQMTTCAYTKAKRTANYVLTVDGENVAVTLTTGDQ